MPIRKAMLRQTHTKVTVATIKATNPQQQQQPKQNTRTPTPPPTNITTSSILSGRTYCHTHKTCERNRERGRERESGRECESGGWRLYCMKAQFGAPPITRPIHHRDAARPFSERAERKVYKTPSGPSPSHSHLIWLWWATRRFSDETPGGITRNTQTS